MTKPIDLSPGRKSITDRYGVAAPRVALAAILTERFGADAAAAILQAWGRAEARYQRAVKVEAARRFVARRPAPEPPLTRADKAVVRAQALLDHAAEYIEGTWKP